MKPLAVLFKDALNGVILIKGANRLGRPLSVVGQPLLVLFSVRPASATMGQAFLRLRGFQMVLLAYGVGERKACLDLNMIYRSKSPDSGLPPCTVHAMLVLLQPGFHSRKPSKVVPAT